jgi:hypothetical protein
MSGDDGVIARLPGRNISKAEIVVRSHDGGKIAVKDFGVRPWIVRNLIGRLFICREAAVYEQLAGVSGVPRFLGRLSPYSLATEWIEGTALAALKATEVDPLVLDRMDEIVARIHRHGVALGDLHRGDVLVAASGDVYLIDFATALRLGQRPGPLRRQLFAWMKDQDRIAMTRIRAWAGRSSSPTGVNGVGADAAKWYARGRRLKRAWDWFRGRHR